MSEKANDEEWGKNKDQEDNALTDGAGAPPYEGKKALVVDDDRVARRVHAKILEKLGFKVTTAPEAETGLIITSKQSFDLILSDLSMPGMSGIDFLREARSRGLKCPFLILTAMGSVPRAVEAIKLGAFEFLQKPMKAEALAAVISDAIVSSEQEKGVGAEKTRGKLSGFKCIFCYKTHPAATRKCPVTGKALSAVQKLSQTVLDGKYKIKDMVGEGGMGTVYEGEHMEIGKRLAVKFLSPSICKSLEVYERFRREAKAAAMVDHKNIVDVSDIGTNPDGIHYIIMEFLSGEDLADRLKDLGKIPLDEACAILSQILEAIGAVHSCGVVHRDLKPENVFLARQSGGSEIVKVLDFGISRLTVNMQKSVRLTSKGRIYGTPLYLSPEQAKGISDVDHRVDIYAVGTIFYEMLQGKPPFDARSYPELLVEIVKSSVPDLKMFIPNFPSAVMDFIWTALEKDPNERFHSAQEMLRELNCLQRDIDGPRQDIRASTFHKIMKPSASKPRIKEVQVAEEETRVADIYKMDTADLADPAKKGQPPPPLRGNKVPGIKPKKIRGKRER